MVGAVYIRRLEKSPSQSFKLKLASKVRRPDRQAGGGGLIRRKPAKFYRQDRLGRVCDAPACWLIVRC